MMMVVSTSTTRVNIDKILGTSGEDLIISLTRSIEDPNFAASLDELRF